MCATWWKRIPERSVYERPSSVTIGKVCHRKVNVYTSLSAEENVFFVVVGGSRDPCHTRFLLSFHPMYRHIVRTLFNRFANIRPFCYFCKQREKEREGEKGIFPSIPHLGDRFPLRLVCFPPPRSFILFAVLSGPN